VGGLGGWMEWGEGGWGREVGSWVGLGPGPDMGSPWARDPHFYGSPLGPGSLLLWVPHGPGIHYYFYYFDCYYVSFFCVFCFWYPALSCFLLSCVTMFSLFLFDCFFLFSVFFSAKHANTNN